MRGKIRYRTAAGLVALAVWSPWGEPVHARPGDELFTALRWLRGHPFLGPPRLAPVDGLGTVLILDAWQAGRALPGGGSVRLYLDVPEPQPAPPVKHEWVDNRVRREIMEIEQASLLAARPPVSQLLGRIYGPGVGEDYASAEPIPVGPDDLSSGTTIGSMDTGPLVFEYGEVRKGGRYDYVEAWYRGHVGVIQPGSKGPEMRRTVVIVTPPSAGYPGTPSSGNLQGQQWSHAAYSPQASWSSPPALGLRPASYFRNGLQE